MKKQNSKIVTVVFLLLTIGILISAGYGQKDDSSNQQVEKNIKMYTHVWDEILNKGNIDMIDKYFADNYVNKTVTSTVNGKAEAKKYFGAFLTGFSDIDFVVDEVFGVDNRIVKRWTFNGAHTGEFNGIPPTGKRISVSGVSITRISNGTIEEELDYMDDLGFLQQLGVIPAE